MGGSRFGRWGVGREARGKGSFMEWPYQTGPIAPRLRPVMIILKSLYLFEKCIRSFLLFPFRNLSTTRQQALFIVWL